MDDQPKTDEQLVQMICGSEQEREEALHYIYVQSGWRRAAKAVVLAAGGAAPDAEDAIQEAVIVLDNHIRNFRYQQTGNLKNFFLGICRGRWYSARRSVRRVALTDEPFQMDSVENIDPQVIMVDKEKKNMVRDMLDMLDAKCREILSLYKLSYPMEEISVQMDLGNVNNARQKVHKCREKMRKLAASHPMLSEYLTDKR